MSTVLVDFSTDFDDILNWIGSGHIPELTDTLKWTELLCSLADVHACITQFEKQFNCHSSNWLSNMCAKRPFLWA